jgi:hypothetical protein
MTDPGTSSDSDEDTSSGNTEASSNSQASAAAAAAAAAEAAGTSNHAVRPAKLLLLLGGPGLCPDMSVGSWSWLKVLVIGAAYAGTDKQPTCI